MVFTVNPTVLIYPRVIDRNRRFVLEINSSEPPLIINRYEVIEALHILPEEFNKAKALEIWFGLYTKDVCVDLWDVFITHKVIIPTESSCFCEFRSWRKYSWEEAFIHHNATLNYPFVQMNLEGAGEIDRTRMSEFVKVEPPPSIYLDIEQVVDEIKLIDIDDFDWFAENRLNKGFLTFSMLSFLFDLSFGVRSTLDFGVQGEFLKKSIPSGGARHPLEVFYVSFDDHVLNKGKYHYNLRRNSFHCLEKGDFYQEYKEYTFDLFMKYEEPPKGVVIFTSMIERAMWRYRDDRSARAIFMDIGHAVMQLRLLMEELGLETYSYQKFDDFGVINSLKLNGLCIEPFYTSTIL